MVHVVRQTLKLSAWTRNPRSASGILPRTSTGRLPSKKMDTPSTEDSILDRNTFIVVRNMIINGLYLTVPSSHILLPYQYGDNHASVINQILNKYFYGNDRTTLVLTRTMLMMLSSTWLHTTSVHMRLSREYSREISTYRFLL